jgi:hypothetical protein
MHARFSPTIYTPPHDQLEEDNTINLVFVSPTIHASADQSTFPDPDCINQRVLPVAR